MFISQLSRTRKNHAALSPLFCQSKIIGYRAFGHGSSSGQALASENYARLSNFWLPIRGIAAPEKEDAQAKLLRAGYLRQSHAGIFHMLPLGQRVLDKLERLIDKYMLQLGASKVSLSSISSQSLWQRTKRLDGYGAEITTLVAKTVKSHKALPLRLYQIGRKYRDEIRPRHGILRSKEFVMKDLYTFDSSIESALSTYNEARAAYSRLFDELRLPYLIAEASSGDIGGDLSHEYHLPTPVGEDNVISCTACDYVANEELAIARPVGGSNISEQSPDKPPSARVWRGVSKDRKTLVNVWYPASFQDADINTHAIKSVLPDLDSSLEDSTPFWVRTPTSGDAAPSESPLKLVNLVDHRLGPLFAKTLEVSADDIAVVPSRSILDPATMPSSCITSSNDGGPLNLLRIRDGDGCPRCESGTLQVQKAVELGHTFHLGTRYSEPLDARVNVPAAVAEDAQVSNKNDAMVPVAMQMGCHGIGVSRIIGAVADHLADEKGLNWPRAIAPFEVVVVPGRNMEEDATLVARSLADIPVQSNVKSRRPLDLVLDDRTESLPWKLKDADLIGYPIIVVVGRGWAADRLCEVQCRRLNKKENVSFENLRPYIDDLLSQL
ncbi:hypothetical protein F4778DRAFT_419134 [Xylariomycetidae sp. FL2044]|nr:hypothetical protein F4778DRAFT_419134 [Xylariomycetidae sp. FL2044]